MLPLIAVFLSQGIINVTSNPVFSDVKENDVSNDEVNQFLDHYLELTDDRGAPKRNSFPQPKPRQRSDADNKSPIGYFPDERERDDANSRNGYLAKIYQTLVGIRETDQQLQQLCRKLSASRNEDYSAMIKRVIVCGERRRAAVDEPNNMESDEIQSLEILVSDLPSGGVQLAGFSRNDANNMDHFM